ncbi:GNAT family N-acetyltransferase [uncultured Maritimibacter sp.]|jgi:putative acetyltransferase|uniref:GNAT family N-acetyltransferase n=1 Tax=uncultured Maritimibacter sp. TaxID=991866 RepID=UPI00260EF155|nr:GNAT family N-acetyltransferase [uncultured Maritimibacter sp.]
MQIRRYRPEDAGALAQIFHAAVHETAALFYSPEQCAVWSPAPDVAKFSDREADGRSVWVAEGAVGVTGFIELEPDGHIDCFYVHPRGAGRALLAMLIAAAREAGLSRLHVEASEVARPFFAREGFVTGERRDFVRSGVALHNWAMSKTL